MKKTRICLMIAVAVLSLVASNAAASVENTPAGKSGRCLPGMTCGFPEIPGVFIQAVRKTSAVPDQAVRIRLRPDGSLRPTSIVF